MLICLALLLLPSNCMTWAGPKLLFMSTLTEELIGNLNQMMSGFLLQLQIDGAGARAGGK